MVTAQLATLKAEIQNDPRGYGYAASLSIGSDQGLADALNLVRDGSAGTVPATPLGAGGVVTGIVTVKRSDISSQEVLEAIDSRDFPATPDWRQSWFESATQQRTLRLVDDAGANTRVLGNLKRILADTNGSQTRLTALATRPGSRAEELFGVNTIIAATDIAASGVHP